MVRAKEWLSPFFCDFMPPYGGKKEVEMKRLNRIPALLLLMMLVCTAACGRKEQNADDMANSMTETSQAAGETHTDAVLPENETGSTGINGSNLGTTGETATETMEETAGGNSTANESSGIIDDTGNVIDDAGEAVGNAADDAGNAVENAADNVGNAVQDVIDGAGDVVKDAADGVKDMTDTR